MSSFIVEKKPAKSWYRQAGPGPQEPGRTGGTQTAHER